MPSQICELYNQAFRNAEQQISDSLIKVGSKLGKNRWMGWVPYNGEFMRNAGTSVKGIRLSRIGLGQLEIGWQKFDGSSDACAEVPRETFTHGSSDFTFGLERFGAMSGSICLSEIPFKQMADKELLHYEDGIRSSSQKFWEEYFRSRYAHFSENKVVALVDASALDGDTFDIMGSRTCFPTIDTADGYMFWHRTATGPSITATSNPIDERYISVNVDPANINRIAELSPDLLMEAVINMEFEDTNRPLLDEGIPFFRVVTPDSKIPNRLAQIDRIQEATGLNGVVFDGKELTQTYGIDRVLRNRMAISYDPYGMKFYPDNAHNATLEAYDATAPETWPRFVRVLPYIPKRLANGTVDSVVNRYYMGAPFGISAIFTKEVMGWRSFPEAVSVGSATKGGMARNYNGSIKWVNRWDKICNPNEEIGHWEMDFGAGIEPSRPEFGWTFFHRIDHSKTLVGNSCSIPNLPQIPGSLTIDEYRAVLSGESAFGVEASSLGANTTTREKYARQNYWF